MVRKISWEEFRNSGMLWWINMILHTFGLAIVYEMEDGNVTEVYPARTKYRGFSEKDNTDGYKKVSKYINDNASDLMKESRSKIFSTYGIEGKVNRMSDDLISRKALLKQFSISDSGRRIPEYDIDNFPITLSIKDVKEIVRKAPTTFDKEK